MPDMSENVRLSDAALIAKCLAQEADAWEVLIRRYQRLIASIAVKYRLSPEDASDVLQSVFMHLFQQLPELRQQEKLSSWLITVTVRECWKLKRRQQPVESLDDPAQQQIQQWADDTHLKLDQSLLEIEQQHRIRHALEQLSEQCRKLLEELFYREETASYADISRRLGLPVASIGPTRARCLEKLRLGLKKLGFFF